jgi:hypothetical protein
MADDGGSGEQVRQHMREMLLRLAALQRKRAQEQDNPPRSGDTTVEVERENDLLGTIRNLQRPA